MDSRARLVDNEWLAEIQRREHRFLPSPHPLCPQVTPDVFNDGKWMAQHGFEHPLLVLERLPSIHLPDNLPLTLVAIANLIGALPSESISNYLKNIIIFLFCSN